MSVLSRIASIFRKKKPGNPKALSALRAAYDGAATNRIREKTWEDAGPGDADADLIPELATMRNRARHEIRNNPYARGIMLTNANYTIGKSLRIQMRTGNDEFDDAWEKMWNTWAPNADAGGRCSFTELLHLGEQQIMPAGEYFAITTSDDSIPGIPALRYMMIEPDRIDTPFDMVGSSTENVQAGIEINANGKPTAYWASKKHPGSNFSIGFDTSTEFTRYPASAVKHVLNTTRPGQTRGEPKICAALNRFCDFRRYRNATILAAEQAALFSAYLETSNPATEVTNSSDGAVIVDIEPATITSLPDGYRIAQIKPEQPATTFEMFSREMLVEIGASVNMPYNVVSMNSKGYNYASTRQDWQAYHRSIGITQKSRERSFIGPAVADFTAEFKMMTMGKYPIELYEMALTQWRALWQGYVHVDPAKEANANKTQLENGSKTHQRIYAELGLDWKEELAQWATERKMIGEMALTDSQALPPNPPEAEEEDDDEKDEDED